MRCYISKKDIEEISRGMINLYFKKAHREVEHRVDIEDFSKSFLGLKIEYVSFADPKKEKIGFLADGETPLVINSCGKRLQYIFPNNTILLDDSLLKDAEPGRRQFTIAHEAAHYILKIIDTTENQEVNQHSGYNDEVYSIDELSRLLAAKERQADQMAASLLMPEYLVDQAMNKFLHSNLVKAYGEDVLSSQSKLSIKEMSRYLGVSYKSLLIRLKELNKIEYHDITEYISKELHIGG